MRIIIVGAGSVGSQLAERLSKENHDVTVIEKNKEHLRKLQDELDVLVIEGNGASPKALDQAGLDRCDMLMAMTNSDETNIVASMSACRYNTPFKVARVSNQDYSFLDAWLAEKDLGVDLMVNPELECALQIRALLEVTGATDVAEFGGGQALLVGLEVMPEAPCAGETLQDVMLRMDRHDFLVASVTRDDRTLIPSGQTRLQVGDRIYLICLRERLDEIYRFCGLVRRQVDRVMILGGSKVAVYLARMLERKKVDAILIENDAESAESLAEELDRTLVVQGEGTNVELWEMEGLDEMDAFLALTRDDETNLLSGLIARSHKVPTVIALLEKLNYVPLVNKVGVNTAVSSRLAIVDKILKFVRRGNILSLATLKGNEAEIIEFYATENCKVLDKPLKDLKLPPEVLFGMVSRGREVFIPTGYTQIQKDDKVVMIAGPHSRSRVEALFP